jgi:transposase
VPVPRVAQRMQQPIGAAAATGTGANAVLEVVSEQRDRLRIRVQQLEEEQLKLEAATQVAEDAASQAAADKQALLTRLRYAENFSRGSPSNPRTASNNTFSPDEEPSIDP